MCLNVEVNKYEMHLSAIESFTSKDLSRGKSIYLRAKNEAQMLSKACLDFNAFVPLCMDFLQCSDSKVSNKEEIQFGLGLGGVYLRILHSFIV
mmetsp:Transcript_14150/g.20913  ORF Transcript_14150/g.20913 Transcript_14150/m.20913 type:complete len:93 (+) Transcript_14150:191-469(+)